MAWTDETTTLSEMRGALRAFNRERAWEPFHNPRNLAMALSVEAGELLELYLWSRDDGPQPAVAARTPQVAEEAADVLICLLNLCEHAGIDLAAATRAKIEKNAAKYPADVASGRLEKYDELRRDGT